MQNIAAHANGMAAGGTAQGVGTGSLVCRSQRAVFGVEFSDGEICIKVLDSVEAIRQEGEAMHHCVFTNEYYLKADSLILSATIDGKRIETIEVSQTQEVAEPWRV